MRDCPHCAQRIAEATSVCPHCRSEIAPRATAVARAVENARPAGADHSSYLVVGALIMVVGFVFAASDDGSLFGLALLLIGGMVALVGIVALGVLVGLRTHERASGRARDGSRD